MSISTSIKKQYPIVLNDSERALLVLYGKALMPIDAVSMLLAPRYEDRDKILELISSWENSEEYTLYHRAVQETEFHIRQRVVELAKKGASSEILLAEKFLREIKK